jgi:hypothetical protein
MQLADMNYWRQNIDQLEFTMSNNHFKILRGNDPQLQIWSLRKPMYMAWKKPSLGYFSFRQFQKQKAYSNVGHQKPHNLFKSFWKRFLCLGILKISVFLNPNIKDIRNFLTLSSLLLKVLSKYHWDPCREMKYFLKDKVYLNIEQFKFRKYLWSIWNTINNIGSERNLTDNQESMLPRKKMAKS